MRDLGDTANIARAVYNVGAVALEERELEKAAACFAESIDLAQEVGEPEDLAWCMIGVAALACERGRFDDAGRLLGAIDVDARRDRRRDEAVRAASVPAHTHGRRGSCAARARHPPRRCGGCRSGSRSRRGPVRPGHRPSVLLGYAGSMHVRASIASMVKSKIGGSMKRVSRHTVRGAAVVALVAGVTALTLAATGFASTSACSVCGKNLILNPGAEAGHGVTAIGPMELCRTGSTLRGSSAPPPGAASRTAGSPSGRKAPRPGERTTSLAGSRLQPPASRRRSDPRRSSCQQERLGTRRRLPAGSATTAPTPRRCARSSQMPQARHCPH